MKKDLCWLFTKCKSITSATRTGSIETTLYACVIELCHSQWTVEGTSSEDYGLCYWLKCLQCMTNYTPLDNHLLWRKKLTGIVLLVKIQEYCIHFSVLDLMPTFCILFPPGYLHSTGIHFQYPEKAISFCYFKTTLPRITLTCKELRLFLLHLAVRRWSPIFCLDFYPRCSEQLLQVTWFLCHLISP